MNWVHVGNQVGWVAKSPNDRDGAPANLSSGVMMRPVRSPRNGNDGNEIVTGKELQSATRAKGTAAGICARASRLSSRIPEFLPRFAGNPNAANGNQSIVFDRGTHAFINRDASGPDNRGSRAAHVPVRPSPLRVSFLETRSKRGDSSSDRSLRPNLQSPQVPDESRPLAAALSRAFLLRMELPCRLESPAHSSARARTRYASESTRCERDASPQRRRPSLPPRPSDSPQYAATRFRAAFRCAGAAQ